MIKRIIKGVIRRIDPTDKGRVKRLMSNPPKVKEDEMVFVSCPDYAGNPKAIFLYMIEHGYNQRYKMTWLFEYKEDMFDFDIPNVKSELIWNKYGERTPAAQKAIMRARYIFYSHNVNWARKFSPEQTFIDLGHGCGYKANMSSDKKKIYFDYTISVGDMHIEILRKFLKSPNGKVLPFGLPVNEFFKSNRSDAHELANKMKKEASADKLIMWMPTYRKSRISRMHTDTTTGSTGLPILYERNDLEKLNDYCRSKGVLIVIKRHILESEASFCSEKLSNIVIVDDKYFREENADVYEFLADTDALITDYSSVGIDYMLMDRPLGFTLDDFDKYGELRGWSMDNVLDYMPGHHMYTIEDLQSFVDDISDGRDPYREERESVTNKLHKYRDGFSKRILDYFEI